MRTLIILLVISVAGYFWHQRHQRYEEYTGLLGEAKTKKSVADDKERQLKNLQARIEPLKKAEAEFKQPGGSPEDLKKEVLEMRDYLTAGAAKLESAEDDYLAAVNDVREEGKKITHPLLKLPNGEELKNAHITGFGEGYVKVAHDDGSVKLMSDDLPEGWEKQYDVDYVSRHSKEENAALNAKVQETLLTPLDLKKAKLGEIEDRLKQVNDRLMAYSATIRESRRQADELVRNAYRISLGSGPAANSAANRRDAMFKQAKDLEKSREISRQQYVALRKQKEELERQRLAIRKMPISSQPGIQPTPQP